MTHLRQIMLEELERRNYAPSTIRAYIRTVEHFARHFHCAPDKLGADHIRQYQVAMFRTGKLAPNTVTQRLAALRFLYIQVLKRGWSVAETPYPKKVLHLPQILSQQEVARLIDATETPFQRILLMTLYATGARRAEVAQLKVTDIDSQRMVVHIRGGKGRKDRDVMLSPALSVNGPDILIICSPRRDFARRTNINGCAQRVGYMQNCNQERCRFTDVTIPRISLTSRPTNRTAKSWEPPNDCSAMPCNKQSWPLRLNSDSCLKRQSPMATKAG